VEVIKDSGNGSVESSIERDGIVASWCGRFDDLTKTHERLEILIEWYNAWTIVENNVALFIQYMISKRKQRYLVPKDMILSLEFVNRKNEYETANIVCGDEANFYEINVFGGPLCVMFTLSKKVGSMNIPVMEGDLDIHAVSAIKHQISTVKKKHYKTQKSVATFTDNAKKFTI
jgi:hypothetical protein